MIVLAIGGNEQTSREAWSLNHMGDATDLELVGRQNELVDAMLATGKPVIALLFNGRPLAATYVSEHVPAILECWYLGQECGHAVAEVLFGDFNPGGKLPITIPRSAGHVPAFYNHKPSARRGYLFDDVTPLYAFGFGLSYTTFRIDDVRLERSTHRAARIDARDGDGDEHRQSRGHGSRAAVHPRPRELGDAAGEGAQGFRESVRSSRASRQTVSIDITPESLAFYDIDMQRVVEPGEFEIMVGTSSRTRTCRRLF